MEKPTKHETVSGVWKGNDPSKNLESGHGIHIMPKATGSSTGEMVERVARAISDSLEAGLPKHARLSWSDLSGPAKAAYLARARAAIEAMREPTKEMVEEGAAHSIVSDLVWQTMIDEALR